MAAKSFFQGRETNDRLKRDQMHVQVPDVEGDLDRLGVDEGRAAGQGMRQTREVVGENELSELGKYCTSCHAVT